MDAPDQSPWPQRKTPGSQPAFRIEGWNPSVFPPKGVIAGQVLQISQRAMSAKGVDQAMGTTLPMCGDTDIAPQEVEDAGQS
jgi:hypothetical protein